MHLLFDLDGTLTDSSPGIVRCINHALVALQREPVAERDVMTMIGAPLSDIFATLLGTTDPATIEAAIAAYRVRFNDVGIFENALFPGIAEALAEFRQLGHSLQIVTNKPSVSARRVIDHFDIARFFDAVHGPDLTNRACRKTDLVGEALRAVAGSADRAAMIGDRPEDILAARSHAIPGVAVGWGYGSRQ